MTPGEGPDPRVVVRPAQPGDVAVMVELVRALAEYERSADQVQLRHDDLDEALFGPSPRVFAHVAEHRGAVVGLAVWFVNYSTWTGHHGIYLEDLFVLPTARGLGAGRALLAELAKVAMAHRYARLELAVLDWNAPAIGFYRHLGARPQDGWTVFRLSGADLARLAEGTVAAGPAQAGSEGRPPLALRSQRWARSETTWAAAPHSPSPARGSACGE